MKKQLLLTFGIAATVVVVTLLLNAASSDLSGQVSSANSPPEVREKNGPALKTPDRKSVV